MDGQRYLVHAWKRAGWVRNVRAADGLAVLWAGRRRQVRLKEVAAADRAPIIKRYLACAPGARAHIPVSRRLPVDQFERIAAHYPVFRIETTDDAAAPTLWRRWTLTVTVGEFAGFAFPADVGAVAASANWAAGRMYPLMLRAGFVEGLFLGYAQAWTLRDHLPQLPRRTFAIATRLAAVIAYAIGMLPSALGGLQTTLPALAVAAGAAAGGGILLASIGTAQWLVLR